MTLLPAILFLLAAIGSPQWKDNDWKPIDQAQLALKSGVVEKDADAEAIFWEVLVDVTSRHVETSHYVRIKVFTERGRDSQSTVELPYSSKEKIEDIAGRTIKRDGTVVYLDKAAIFERTVVKAKRIQIKVRSFALPQVEPGAIIEYRWREVRDYQPFIRLPFQRDIPVQLVKYYLKTPSDFRASTKPFNGEFRMFLPETDKLKSTSLTNVPAFHREPDMPPEDVVRPWMLLYFTPYLYFDTINKYRYDSFVSNTKLNDELRKTALAAVGGAATLEQKLQRLFDFCRSSIKRIDPEAAEFASSDRANSHQKAAETLKARSGTSEEINLLFAALAAACGIDARLALAPDRSDIFLDPLTVDPIVRLYFLRNQMIAVKIDGKWRYFDPGSIFMPYGMLPWEKEAVGAVIVGHDGETFHGTSLSEADRSSVKRTAKLRLSEDGTLEGDIRMEYYGHLAAEEKESNRDDSPAEREKSLRDLIKKRMSAAELSNIRVENASDSVQPFVYAFHVKAPGYAQRTGKRLFFQPAFFQYGTSPRFAAPTRKHPVYFHYPWQEEDDIEIDLPAGFALDHAESIGSFDLADIGKYAVRIAITEDRRTLSYKRSMSFAVGGRLLIPAPSYASLKKILDTTHELDSHIITLKQGGKDP